MSPLLELSGVSVAIGNVTLIDRISLGVEPGRILGLVGESGGLVAKFFISRVACYND